MGSCFMFGHTDCPDCMLPRIEKAIEYYYSQYEITDYYIGNRGRFDSLAATAVQRVKQQHPDIRMYLVLAYHPSERPADLWGGFDGSYYPPLENTPRQFTIIKANRYMVDTTDFLICYVKHFGNTRNLLEYAQQRIKDGVHIENVAEDS